MIRSLLLAAVATLGLLHVVSGILNGLIRRRTSASVFSARVATGREAVLVGIFHIATGSVLILAAAAAFPNDSILP